MKFLDLAKVYHPLGQRRGNGCVSASGARSSSNSAVPTAATAAVAAIVIVQWRSRG
jgi:hypothetical protein